MQDNTRTALLEAAERILIEEGVRALTVRRVGTVSGLNPTLVTYHFGGVAGLLSELCRHNLEPMMAQWDALDLARPRNLDLHDMLLLWLRPLVHPSAFTPHGRSIVVFDEIASHGDSDLRQMLLSAMVDVSRRVHAALHPLLPHIDAFELRARVRFISAAALGPPPRARAPLDMSKTGDPLDSLFYLLPFAEGALMAAPAKKAKKPAPSSA